MSKKDADILAAIKQAVNAGIAAGRKEQKNPYRDTEKRLYSYPLLLKRVEANKAALADMLAYQEVPHKSADIVRFKRTGIRLSENELLEAAIQDMRAEIAADEYEIEAINKALDQIAGDPYFPVIEGKYLLEQTDEEIAEIVPCALPTVRKHRGRLINRLAVWLYGAAAL